MALPESSRQMARSWIHTYEDVRKSLELIKAQAENVLYGMDLNEAILNKDGSK